MRYQYKNITSQSDENICASQQSIHYVLYDSCIQNHLPSLDYCKFIKSTDFVVEIPNPKGAFDPLGDDFKNKMKLHLITQMR